MQNTLLNKLIITLISFLIISCGGGGSSQIAGIGGTGVTSSGSITGFGSIFVNGVKYETGGSTTVSQNGNSLLVSDLKLGMTVTVRGTLNNNAITGTADTVAITSELDGPISAAPIEDNTTNTKSFIVLGRSVIISPSSTVFDGSSFSYTNVAQSDVVEIHGYLNNNGTLIATRIEKTGTLSLGSTQVEINGILDTILSSVSFTLNVNGNMITVNHSGSTNYSGLIGQAFRIEGTITNTSEISASSINQQSGILNNQDNEVEIEGIITNYVSDSNFKINGIQVNAGSATLNPGTLVLANDVKVEVEGTYNTTSNTLIASEVESETTEIKISTTVSSVNTSTGTITLDYNGQPVDVLVNNKTTLEDETSNNALTINNISSGDYLELEAALDNNSNPVALDIHRKSMGSEAKLKAAITSFDTTTAGAESVTILRVTYPSDGSTVFKEDDVVITRSAFLLKLTANPVAVVKVKDNYVGGSLDGVADEMEIDN